MECPSSTQLSLERLVGITGLTFLLNSTALFFTFFGRQCIMSASLIQKPITSLDEVKSNIDKIRGECYKINRDFRAIQIAAILYPNVSDSGYTDKQMWGKR
jgi:hypothetical protein